MKKEITLRHTLRRSLDALPIPGRIKEIVDESLLQRAERAEARVKELEAAFAAGKQILLTYCGPNDEPLLAAIEKAFAWTK